ncbi:MAG: methyltransferase [Verrucomicrobia bacterium]|nr:methyltransferase [Verrucomicrobiota bacterium]
MMLDLTLTPRTDPLPVYRYRDGLYAVDLLTAAITEFDFFTWLAAHPSDLATICRHFGTAARPTDVMLTLFTAQGFIHRADPSPATPFHATDLAREHLVSTSPFFLGPYYASLKERPVVRDFVAILRTDRPANWGSYKHEKTWTEAMLTDEFATTFTAAMDCRGFTLGPALAKALPAAGCTRLLDIAGGSGIYACAIVAHHAHLAATVFERAPVDTIARRMIAKRGYADRVTVTVGDMFTDPLPAGHDLHLYSNVIHDWDVAKVRPLLAASFAALPPGGLLAIHDCHLHADKSGPLPVAAYSALLMSVTEGKCYSVAEMEELLREAGFRRVTFTPTICDRSLLIAQKPA